MQLPQPIQSNQGNRLKLSYLGLAVRVRGVSGWLGKQSTSIIKSMICAGIGHGYQWKPLRFAI